MNNRKLLVIMICIFLMCSFIGCNSNNKMVALRIGGALDGEYENSIAEEYELWSQKNINPHIDESADKKSTVSLNGGTYTGDYESSKVEFMTNYRLDKYISSEGYFEVNADSNSLEFIHIFSPTIKEKKFTLEEGIAIVENIAKKYINIDDYRLEYYENSSFYDYCYKKYICEIETSEKLSISLNFDGTIRSMRIQMCNAFPKHVTENVKNRVEELNSEYAINLIDKKIESIYDIKNNSSINYKIKNKWLVLDDNDVLSMLYMIEVSDSKSTEENLYSNIGTIEMILVR